MSAAESGMIDPYRDFRDRLANSGCARCGLSEGRSSIVVDRGNPGACVMIIGEAPGASEDRQGAAFVGRAGRLLDALFEEAGMDTNRDTLIANIVKCRPPNNRPPTPDEAAACLPFLRRQLELVSPRFVVLLGATALKHLLPHRVKAGLQSVVGTLFEDPGFPGKRLAVLYHPAYILRDPRKRPMMLDHIRRLANAFREETVHGS